MGNKPKRGPREIRWSLPDASQIDLPHLKLACREFIPKNTDTHFLTWQVDGKVIVLELPPFAGHDSQLVIEAVDTFLNEARASVLDTILASLTDELSILTMREAIVQQCGRTCVEHPLRIVLLSRKRDNRWVRDLGDQRGEIQRTW
jgi:hypothetical protein